jgi:hypothetical protein
MKTPFLLTTKFHSDTTQNRIHYTIKNIVPPKNKWVISINGNGGTPVTRKPHVVKVIPQPVNDT